MMGLLAADANNGYVLTILIAAIAALGTGGAALIRSFTVDRRTATRDDIDSLWEENRLLREENEGIRATNRSLNDQLFALQGQLATAATLAAKQDWQLEELKRKLSGDGSSEH